MTRTGSHRDLIVWQKAVLLASLVYEASRRLPPRERLGLTGEMRRAAVCVASSIAEGSGRSIRSEYIQFLNMARGSLSELETQIAIATQSRLLEQDLRLEETIADVGRLLAALILKLRERSDSGFRPAA